MSDIRSRFGERVRALRENLGLSQDELARSAGLSRNFVGSVERGAYAATIETIEKLARGLGIAPHELFQTRSFPGYVRGDVRLMRFFVTLDEMLPKRDRKQFEEIALAVARTFMERSKRGRR